MRLLGIYLNDHLAGATGRVELARRVARSAWSQRTLRALAGRDGRLDSGRLDELISRAGRQADLLEDVRVHAAKQSIAARTRLN
jgi:hypothetical protein